MDDIAVLSELKKLILSKTGIRTITPADCKTISIEISKTLNKNVSETTIKRLFGFAAVRHNFSKFTLTTLAEYVRDMDSAHIGQIITSGEDHGESNWITVHEKAVRITEFTIKSIKNRSGIPYHMTVNRKFSEHDFEDFANGSFSFTAFISQPGYGKTIILAHLAEKFLQEKSKISVHKSTLVFVTIYSLFNKDNVQFNFESLLKDQLGIPENQSLISLANDNFRTTGGKLFIFLDGFSEILIQKDFKKQLFDNIIDFICAIEDSNAIKIVMSMRSTTWSRFYDCIRSSAFLKRKWFPGNYFNLTDISNVPALTEKEVDLIMTKMEHLDARTVNPRLKNQLKYPFHIQLYYQLKEEDPYFNYSTNITFYELISRFIQDKIYRSNYYTEKILFLKKIIQLTELGKKRYVVTKDDLISELSAFKNAYMELLSDGILMEEKFPDEVHPKEYVSFIQPHIFEYFLFIEVLETFHLKIDEVFFNYLKKEYKNHHARFQLLQWTIRFSIRIGEFDTLRHVFNFELNNFERNYIILFIAENLDYRKKYSNEQIKPEELYLLHEIVIEQLLVFDFADACYKEAIPLLASLTDNHHHQTIYNSILAVYSILSLDVAKMEDIYTKFTSAKNDEKDGVHFKLISNFLEIIKGDHSRAEEMLQSFIAYINKLPTQLSVQDKISLLGISFSATLLNNQRSVPTLLSAISGKINTSDNFKDPFTILISASITLINLVAPGSSLKPPNNQLAIVDSEIQRTALTAYSESLLRLNQTFQLKNDQEYKIALQQAIELLKIFKVNHLNLNALLTYDLIIEILKQKKDSVKQNEYRYEKLCFAEEHHLVNALVNKGV